MSLPKEQWNALNAEEQRVIVHKGTEMPFTGEYNSFKGVGTFVCRRCEHPCTDQIRSLIQVADGLPSTMIFPVMSNVFWTKTEDE